MAQQESIIKLKGRIGDLTFYKTRDGYQARSKGGISADRIANDPKFQRTRENGAEFGRAVQAAKRMRSILRSVTLQNSDRRMASRLMSRLMRVIKADTVNDRGLRQVLGANTPILKGFSFNTNASLDNTFFVALDQSIDRATGTISVSLPAFDAEVKVAGPPAATHFQLTAAGAAIDFGQGLDSALDVQQSPILTVKEDVEAMQLDISLPAASTQPLFLIFGVSFFQQVNEKPYPLQNGIFNALSILNVNGE